MDSTTDDRSSIGSSPSPGLPPQSRKSMAEFNLKESLKSLIESAPESWTYAILWQCSYTLIPQPVVLNFWDGYYRGKGEAKADQKVGKQVRIFGSSATIMDEEVSDGEWFFKISMAQSSSVNEGDLPGQAWYNPVWITGANQLSNSAYGRAKWGQEFGLQTLLCIPFLFGVLELASTELILQNFRWIDEVKVFLQPIESSVINDEPLQSECKKSSVIDDESLQLEYNKSSMIDESLQPKCNNLHEQQKGKGKISDLKCSWTLLTESSNKGSGRRSYYSYSNSNEYSGPYISK